MRELIPPPLLMRYVQAVQLDTTCLVPGKLLVPHVPLVTISHLSPPPAALPVALGRPQQELLVLVRSMCFRLREDIKQKNMTAARYCGIKMGVNVKLCSCCVWAISGVNIC